MRYALGVVTLLVAAAALGFVTLGGDASPRLERNLPPRAEASPEPAQERQESIDAAGISEQLRAIARAAGSEQTRAAGTPGDRATADHAAARLRAAGYRVAEQAFRVPVFIERSPSRVSGLRRGRDFSTMTFSGSGSASGRVRRVGLGCTPADYAPLRRGEIAVARRGVCTFLARSRLAQRRGAAGLLVVSDLGPPFTGSLQRPDVRIPVLSVSTRVGREISGRVRVRVDAISERSQTRNIVAEAGPEDAERVYMAGAHLDSVPKSPGMNDNASGVAAALEAAEQLAGRPPPEGVAIRFGFWAAEEMGLVGARRYVARLPRGERRRIRAYVNLDMVGSPGERVRVYGGEGAAGRAIEAALRAELPDGAPEGDMGGSSDHAAFDRSGIPVGGLFTRLDRCYHRACDRLGNVDARRAAQAARATHGALLALAGG